MASFFRKSIARRILSSLRPFLDQDDFRVLKQTIPQSTKLCKLKDCQPKFEIYWKELIKLKPELELKVHPVTLYTCLKNQDLGTKEGIVDVDMEETPHQKYLFSVDKRSFNEVVLLEVHYNIEDFIDRNTFFSNIFPENVIVEFSSPNIAKPFHYGHFRSTILGNFLTNLFKYVGHNVTTINYVGDWGLQYGILATGFKQFGSEQELKADPLSHLYKVYIEANRKIADDPAFNESAKKHFQEMEKGDSEALEQWNNFRNLSLEKINETYKCLGIHFDETHGESMYVRQTKEALDTLLQKGIASCESDGSVQTYLPEVSEDKIVLKKSDGTSLYLSRDIAAALDRQKKFHFDSMYYVVDSSQSKHFAALFSLLKAMDCTWHAGLHHVLFGRISNFSSRKGNAVFLHDILEEAQGQTLERMKNSPTTKVTDNWDEVAFNLGVSALVVNDLGARRKKSFEFNWERVLSMTADSGITLQYCHARLQNLKKNCGVELGNFQDLQFLIEPEAHELVDVIARFDESLYQAYKELEPFHLVHYLFNLKRAVNKANKTLTVKGQPLDLAKARLLLFHTAHLVLHKGLKILGLRPLDQI